MRTFYSSFSNWNALRTNLRWTHYRSLLQEGVRNEIHLLEKGIDVKDIIHDPCVLEFLGQEHTPNLYEKESPVPIWENNKFLICQRPANKAR